MERLTDKELFDALNEHEKDCCRCRERICTYESDRYNCLQDKDKKAYKELAEYRRLEEQGLLHKAPLKDGTPIWYVLNIFDEVMYVTNTTYIFGVTEYEIGEFGKKFWLSEEEAEKALAEMEK